MRTVLTNPFQPGSGVVPQVWVGRDVELGDVAERVVPRRRAGLFERGRTYLGEPGMGKSVLVNRIASERRAAGDLVAEPLRLARGRDPLAALADAVRPLLPTGEALAGRLADALGRVRDVGLLGGRVAVAPPAEDRYAGLAALLRALAEEARDRERLLVLRVDEVQNLAGDGLSQVLTLLGDLLEATVRVHRLGEEVEEHLPVVVLLSGLPQFTSAAADAGATFSRRFATAYLDPFTDEEVRAALAFAFDGGWEVLGDEGPAAVHLQHSAREALVRVCGGDPFLFQLAGAAAWDAGTTPIITAEDVERGWERVRREVDAHLRSRIAGLTELQLQVLRAAVGLGGEGDGTAIARRIGRSGSSAIGSTLQGLVGKRLLVHEVGGYRVVSRALLRHLAGER